MKIIYPDKKYIRSEMRKLMKCMNYTLAQSEKKNANSIYLEMYTMLGAHAWTTIAQLCEKTEHEFRISKKYPTGRCKNCGTIRKIK